MRRGESPVPGAQVAYEFEPLSEWLAKKSLCSQPKANEGECDGESANDDYARDTSRQPRAELCSHDRTSAQ